MILAFLPLSCLILHKFEFFAQFHAIFGNILDKIQWLGILVILHNIVYNFGIFIMLMRDRVHFPIILDFLAQSHVIYDNFNFFWQNFVWSPTDFFFGTNTVQFLKKNSLWTILGKFSLLFFFVPILLDFPHL